KAECRQAVGGQHVQEDSPNGRSVQVASTIRTVNAPDRAEYAPDQVDPDRERPGFGGFPDGQGQRVCGNKLRYRRIDQQTDNAVGDNDRSDNSDPPGQTTV